MNCQNKLIQAKVTIKKEQFFQIYTFYHLNYLNSFFYNFVGDLVIMNTFYPQMVTDPDYKSQKFPRNSEISTLRFLDPYWWKDAIERLGESQPKVTSVMKLKGMKDKVQLVVMVLRRYDDEKQKIRRPRNQQCSVNGVNRPNSPHIV